MGRTALLALCLPLLLAGCGGEETAQAVPQEISGKMGLHGALLIGL